MKRKTQYKYEVRGFDIVGQSKMFRTKKQACVFMKKQKGVTRLYKPYTHKKLKC